VPEIDWDEVEGIRTLTYPKIPKKALKILRKLVELRPGLPAPDCYIHIDDAGGGYPPDPIPVYRSRSCVIWVLDLLDRFGGEMTFGSLTCNVRRKKKRLPVFTIQEITEGKFNALSNTFGNEFEHFVQSSTWQMLGKRIEEFDLLVVLIRQRKDDPLRFLGFMDRMTFRLLVDRMGEDFSIEKLLSYGGYSV
jgi:hypothetical protein